MKLQKKKFQFYFFPVVILILSMITTGSVWADETEEYAQTLVIEDGMAQPMLEYSNYLDEDYSNEDSDILRFTVYVETDHDTDNDGMADLVKVFMQVPRAAVEGNYKAAVIYDPTPYNAGTVEEYWGASNLLYNETRFDYNILYKDCEKRIPDGEISTMEQALSQDQSEWNYEVPGSGAQGYDSGQLYDYYLIRGFAIAEASGIGTYGSEGFELCGFDLERDAHKCVVEWLAGNRVAYADRNGTTEIKADWSNGKVAMTGCSYGGTLPYEVATTGVEGLETIIPYAGIASWYDYTNSQGVAKFYNVNYADMLASYNGGGLFLDENWSEINQDYASWLYTVAQDEEETNGNYADIWKQTDYSDDYENIRCSALVVQGLNDFNVTTKQADLMYQAFKKAGQKVSLILHQDAHNFIYRTMVDDSLWDEIMNEWLCHYLYGTDNGIENLPEVLCQSNLDGSYSEHDSWRDFNYQEMSASYGNSLQTVSTYGFADFIDAYIAFNGDTGTDTFYLDIPEENAAVYDIEIPEGTTIYGVPKITFKASSEKIDFSGLMISAVLVDTIDGEQTFEAYIPSETLPTNPIDKYDIGGGYGEDFIYEYVQTETTAKTFTYGWTDLDNPGHGYNSSEYTEDTQREAGIEYEYTFYMMPTVYTVAPGHTLKLVIYTWDPNTPTNLDESFGTDDEDLTEYYNYEFTINNDSLDVEIPVLE